MARDLERQDPAVMGAKGQEEPMVPHHVQKGAMAQKAVQREGEKEGLKDHIPLVHPILPAMAKDISEGISLSSQSALF